MHINFVPLRTAINRELQDLRSELRGLGIVSLVRNVNSEAREIIEQVIAEKSDHTLMLESKMAGIYSDFFLDI